MKLSLCMIVRDNVRTIEPCLESIQPWVDEIIVVDTGSRDETPEIARRYGASLFHFPWCDDFSTARNESLRHARGEWIFWMDSDDTISPECGARLRELVSGQHSEHVLGYVMQVHCPGAASGEHREGAVVDHVKVFRNRVDLRFTGRIHEQILPAIRRASGEVARTDIYVDHSGHDHSVASREHKLQRDLRLLHLELEEHPQDPFVLYCLGMTYASTSEDAVAIYYLERCLQIADAAESYVRAAYALLAHAMARTHQPDAAWNVCQRGLGIYPKDKPLLFRSGILQHQSGNLSEAATTYLKVLNETEDPHFLHVDRGIDCYKARHNLALVYEDMLEHDQAEAQWRKITEEEPSYKAGWYGLSQSLLNQNKHAVANTLAEELLQMPALRSIGLCLAGRLAQARGELNAAIALLELADREDPSELIALRALCHLLFERCDPQTAINALRELTRRAPQDAAAFHNLGSLYLETDDCSSAIKSFRESLRLRPQSAVTEANLRAALQLQATLAGACEGS